MENRTDNLETPKLVSFIIPCYHSAKTLPFVVEEIERTMQALPQYRTQIVMVNDDPKDGTWSVIQKLCHEKTGRDGICFARNFGQHAALMAGIRRAQGDILVCLDDDGQTPACEAPELIAAIENGADAAYAKYEKKQHSGFRNFGSSVNEKMCEILLGKPKELYVSSYFAMRRFVAEEVKRYENSYPYLLGLVLRSTTSIVNVPVHHRKRESGTSGYTLRKLFGLWMNGFTAFSIEPLRIATKMGAVFAFVSFIYGIYTIIKKIINPAVPMGFSAMMTAIIFFGGMLMLMVGLAGEYIGRTYISVNRAPQYVIRETTGAQPDGAPAKRRGNETDDARADSDSPRTDAACADGNVQQAGTCGEELRKDPEDLC
ncbi:MAG TPA: glycosyltransferase [Lachnospiraceae bacterium]|nr:glycosyltransferase [Lachnospiraceae bacterium]HAP72529.1 glycosyltransferase [Lachnospiraceae bacterium]